MLESTEKSVLLETGTLGNASMLASMHNFLSIGKAHNVLFSSFQVAWKNTMLTFLHREFVLLSGRKYPYQSCPTHALTVHVAFRAIDTRKNSGSAIPSTQTSICTEYNT